MLLNCRLDLFRALQRKSQNLDSAARLLLSAILRDDAPAYLRGAEAFLFLQLVSEQGFFDADGAMRGVIVREAGLQTLVAEALVAVAVTRKLRDGLRHLFDRYVSQTGLPRELRRRQDGRQILQVRFRRRETRHAPRRAV